MELVLRITKSKKNWRQSGNCSQLLGRPHFIRHVSFMSTASQVQWEILGHIDCLPQGQALHLEELSF